MNRRNFIKIGATTAAVTGVSQNILGAEAKGANDAINVALIGCGGRGGGAAWRGQI